MNPGWRRALKLVATVAVLAIAATTAPNAPSGSGIRASLITRPNIVLILTDDQRWDSLWAMPKVQAMLMDHGMTFQQSYVANPACCPSRASILTGEGSGTTDVWANSGPHGGFHRFDDRSTIAVWLHDAGYETALMGKYLNGYTDRHASYVPPGWDTWDAFSSNSGQGNYFNYDLDQNGVVRYYGSAPADYSTDVLAGDAQRFILGANPTSPIFLYLATRAPHQLAIPAPRDRDAFRLLPGRRPPSYNEADVSDKPAYIRSLPRLGPAGIEKYDTQERNADETLLAVDDLVGKVVRALAESSRLSNTLIMFASDNGVLFGEHRWVGKWVPYEESIRVPTVVRYDPLTTTPRTDASHLVLNLDWAPTFAALAGVPDPGAQGSSLLPLIAGTPVPWRTRFLIDHLESVEGIPSYCGVHTERYVYVKYTDTGEEELYDLRRDPYELQNAVNDPADARVLADLRLAELRLCHPPPPPVPPRILRLPPRRFTTEP